MKRISTFIIAIALLLGLSQCKKQETPNTTETDGKLVHISVNVNHGSKHTVNPDGTYSFQNGDLLYVGNNGRYIGTLEYQSGVFSGDIFSPSTEDYLHFYFTGGKEPTTAPTQGTTTAFTVSIADQSGNLPVLSYGQSTEKYTTANATYHCALENKCGLVKFVLSEGTSDPITISGMKTTAAINFSAPGITPIITPGNITLYSANETEKWAVLLEQDAVSSSIVTINGTVAAMASVPAIANNNMYSSTGVSITRSTVIEINDSNSDDARLSFNNEATENPILRLTGNINWGYMYGSNHAVTRKDGIIDFNGHTATNMFVQNNVQGQSITLMNGTIHEGNEIGIDGNSGWSDLYQGTVILENMTIEHNKIFTDGHEYIIRSGTYFGICNATQTGYPGTVNIYGGYFGSFFNGAESGCVNGTYVLYGGKYKFKPTTTSYYNVTIPSGYSVKSNPDSDSGTYPWIVSAD